MWIRRLRVARWNEDSGKPAPVALWNTGAAESPPAAVVRKSNERAGLVLWIPAAVGFGGAAAVASHNGYVLGSLGLFALACVAGVLVNAALRGGGLRADQDGVHVRREVRSHHIPWPDLDRIDLDEFAAEDGPSGRGRLIFVTRDQPRIPDRNGWTNGGAPMDELRELADALIAIRHYYAPPGERKRPGRG